MNRLNKEGSIFVLSSGKEVSAYKGIFGLNENLDKIYDGYDGDINLTEYDYELNKEILNYTPEEICEICDYMIDLWSQMKKKIIWSK